MIEIARLPADDRRELFHNTAAKTGLHDAIVEKDFWVCLTLDYLFHRSPWKKAVTFKGGTSLSKGYHLISRFSEDIDLIGKGGIASTFCSQHDSDEVFDGMWLFSNLRVGRCSSPLDDMLYAQRS